MTPEERLKCADYLLHSDVAEDASYLAAGMRKGTKSETEMAKLICTLYRLVHPSGGCENPHEDWEEKNNLLLASIPEETEEQREAMKNAKEFLGS